MTKEMGGTSQPAFRTGIDGANEALEEQEMRVAFDAVELEHRRETERTLAWVEGNVCTVLAAVDVGDIEIEEGLRLIQAIVGYERRSGREERSDGWGDTI